MTTPGAQLYFLMRKAAAAGHRLADTAPPARCECGKPARVDPVLWYGRERTFCDTFSADRIIAWRWS